VNFFEQQSQARRQTRWLLVLFLLAVVLIVVVIDLAVLVSFGLGQVQDGAPLSLRGLVQRNGALLVGATLITLAVIGLSSLFRILRLKSGGGEVARELGGQLLPEDSRDPLHRRYRNVVEEIALASGVPVPEMYVLEQERGINAFAAGFTPADAAVAVTRGALENLSRSELQGVIAHEFSHIFNGDMRINIRLMGVLFGILVLAVVGRRVVMHTRYIGGSRNKNAGGILILAFVLMAVGYIGLFFGRWIKAAVSRQREYLADASAVQFTRDPDSIGGALKKIAVHSETSYLAADTEEVGHMLFGAGQKLRMFATHPPILRRIQRIEPSFTRAELLEFGTRLRQKAQRDARAEQQRVEREAAAQAREGGFDAGGIVQEIGNPGWDRVLLAAGIVASLPEAVGRAARSPEWATELLLTGLLDADPDLREQQLLKIAQELGADSERRVRQMLDVAAQVRPEQRLPLLELALPMIKQRSEQQQASLLKLIKWLIHSDGQVDVFEYLVARLITQYLWEAANPRRAGHTGRRGLSGLMPEAGVVLAVLAMHGQQEATAGEAAWQAGMKRLGREQPGDFRAPANWMESLDEALRKLDRLDPPGRKALVEAMIDTATYDQVVAAQEIELMRAVCAALHVPVPVLNPAARGD
jgi:Zn-dependent protease with chaperone function/uncharacterized tellurite resistance protein B-like protein